MTTNTVAGDRIRAFLERWERLDEERKAIAEDQKEVFAEAKGEGFDVKILRTIIARRKDLQKAQEEDEILDLYEAALGVQPSML